MQIQLGTSKECMFAPINNTPDKKIRGTTHWHGFVVVEKLCP